MRLSVPFKSGNKSNQELSFSLSSVFLKIFFQTNNFRNNFQDNSSGGISFSPHSSVPRRWPDGRSRGFGYVTFSEESPGGSTDKICLVSDILGYCYDML